MIIGVVSDTHGNQEGMRRLAAWLQSLGVQTLLHLGDDYRDQETLTRSGLEVIGVPGLYCPEYRDPGVPNRQVATLGGLKFLLTHTESRNRFDLPGDPDPEMACYKVDAVLFGHTHNPKLEERMGIAWINPGHLRHRTDRGFPPTFALLSISAGRLKAQICLLLNGAPLQEKIFRFTTQR